MSKRIIGGEIAVITREFDGKPVRQRAEDGYFDATAMCKAAGKKWNDYWRNAATKEFIEAMSSEAGIPASDLVQVQKGNPTGAIQGGSQGTWAHPDVAVHLAQWCSPRFAVQVSKWVRELLTRGKVELSPGGTEAAVLSAVERIVDAAVERALASRTVQLGGGATLPGPVWSIRRRLLRRHPDWKTDGPIRAKIRRIANDLISRLLHERVHYDGDECAYFDRHLVMLDEAIDVVKRQMDREKKTDGWGMFAVLIPDE